MAFADSKPTSGAGRRENSAILASATLLAASGWAKLGGGWVQWVWVGPGWARYLHQPLCPSSSLAFPFCWLKSMARGAKAKVHRFAKAAAAKAKAKAKAAPLLAVIAAPPPPLQPPAAGMLNGWIGMACSPTHLNMVSGSNNAVSGVDISAGVLAEAFESGPSGPLLFQGPEFGLRETPPAVVPGLPPQKGLGKGLPRMVLNVNLLSDSDGDSDSSSVRQ